MFNKVTEFLDSYIKDGMPFYDCAVMKDGVCVYRHSNGYTDTESKITVTGKEKYNIYSCSKLITCVAALQLWERGCFSLEDKLSDYMPEFEKMTVKCGDGVAPTKNPNTSLQRRNRRKMRDPRAYAVSCKRATSL